MNLTQQFSKAKKKLTAVQSLAIVEEKAAHSARQTARAAKGKLKQVRKLAKFTRKVARKAEDKAAAALEQVECATEKLEKIQRRIKKELHRRRASQPQAAYKKSAAPAKPKRIIKKSAKTALHRQSLTAEISATAAGNPPPTDTPPIAG